jgi:hypothetical protein
MEKYYRESGRIGTSYIQQSEESLRRMIISYLGKMQGMGRGWRRRNHLPNNLKERRRYKKLKKHKGYVALCGRIALEGAMELWQRQIKW